MRKSMPLHSLSQNGVSETRPMLPGSPLAVHDDGSQIVRVQISSNAVSRVSEESRHIYGQPNNQAQPNQPHQMMPKSCLMGGVYGGPPRVGARQNPTFCAKLLAMMPARDRSSSVYVP